MAAHRARRRPAVTTIRASMRRRTARPRPGRAVRPARVPTRELYALIAEHFRVLGEPARLELLHALADGERSAAELMEQTGLAQANLSKHMSQLCGTGFVTRRRDGAYVQYALTDGRVLQLCEIMCGSVEDAAATRQALAAAR